MGYSAVVVSLKYSDVSEVLTASNIRTMVAQVLTSETSIYFNEIHGAVSQKAVIFTLDVVRAVSITTSF
jgi:hypothetical protein